MWMSNVVVALRGDHKVIELLFEHRLTGLLLTGEADLVLAGPLRQRLLHALQPGVVAWCLDQIMGIDQTAEGIELTLGSARAIGAFVYIRPHGTAMLAPAAVKGAPSYWYDPMRPSEHFDKPGKSPFMDMRLVPGYADGSRSSPGIVRIAVSRRRFNSRAPAKIAKAICCANCIDTTRILVIGN